MTARIMRASLDSEGLSHHYISSYIQFCVTLQQHRESSLVTRTYITLLPPCPLDLNRCITDWIIFLEFFSSAWNCNISSNLISLCGPNYSSILWGLFRAFLLILEILFFCYLLGTYLRKVPISSNILYIRFLSYFFEV